MDDLSNRKKNILKYIIDSYLERMLPIGSKIITEMDNVKVSAATVRNEMCELEALGLITHPHTSAGRIPTDLGYRYYVDNLLESQQLSNDEVGVIKEQFEEKLESLEALIEATSKIVSNLTHEACISTFLRPSCGILKKVDLVLIEPKRVLTIWISTSGLVKHYIVDFTEEITSQYLVQVANFLNKELVGIRIEDVQKVLSQKLASQKDSIYKIISWAKKIASTSIATMDDYKISLNGRNYIFDKPEFQDSLKTKNLFEFFDDEARLLPIINNNCNESSVRITIGDENQHFCIKDCSLIRANYFFENVYLGTVCIVGPKRLEYQKAVPLLSYISELMTKTASKFSAI